jgi:ABC-2 type transport system ATP-binding protein
MSLDLDLSVRAQPALPCRPARPAARAGHAAHRPTAAPAAGLAADLDRPVRELSGGNRRKVELVRACCTAPACC